MELKGKRITFLGDSITEGWGTTCTEARYDNVLARRAELGSTYADGIGGTRIAHQRCASADPRQDLCFCGRAAAYDMAGDVIVVFGGTNDYGHGNAPFGADGNRTPDTFCGAVDCLMRTLTSKYPDARIVFMTPTRRQYGEMPSPVTGRTLGEYAAAIGRAGKRHGIPVLDLYNSLPLDPDREEDRLRYTTDGLHPNDAGHELIARALHDFLSSL